MNARQKENQHSEAVDKAGRCHPAAMAHFFSGFDQESLSSPGAMTLQES
ncbi:hypothetical protein [Noviherbaspirillum humi]|nr:hypothetical protein [Noviherbaspirillum humi]